MRNNSENNFEQIKNPKPELICVQKLAANRSVYDISFI